METQLALDNQGKELQLLFKKNLQHPSGLELKIDGALNTVTAESHATARLSKVGQPPCGKKGSIMATAWCVRL